MGAYQRTKSWTHRLKGIDMAWSHHPTSYAEALIKLRLRYEVWISYEILK